jgi:hypothetical protein
MGEWSPGFPVAAPATCPVALRARIRRCRLPTGSPFVADARRTTCPIHRPFGRGPYGMGVPASVAGADGVLIGAAEGASSADDLAACHMAA